MRCWRARSSTPTRSAGSPTAIRWMTRRRPTRRRLTPRLRRRRRSVRQSFRRWSRSASRSLRSDVGGVIAAPRRSFSISIPGRAPLVLGPRTLVMGVLNVTPDSFSDGGKALDAAHALDIALAMEASGADIIDVGAESTRPGAPAVSAHDEIARVLPVLKAIVPRVKLPISIDTYKAATARVAITEGVAIVNDISAFNYDPELAPLVAELGVPAVLMHTRGRPDDMYAHADYTDVVGEIGRASCRERV